MNASKNKLLTLALIAGLSAGSIAFADEAAEHHEETAKAKADCKGKNGCSGEHADGKAKCSAEKQAKHEAKEAAKKEKAEKKKLAKEEKAKKKAEKKAKKEHHDEGAEHHE